MVPIGGIEGVYNQRREVPGGGSEGVDENDEMLCCFLVVMTKGLTRS